MLALEVHRRWLSAFHQSVQGVHRLCARVRDAARGAPCRLCLELRERPVRALPGASGLDHSGLSHPLEITQVSHIVIQELMHERCV